MKKNIICLLSSFMIICGCKEEFIGQYPVDKDPPGIITNVSAENIPGGAIISYTLPEEKDLLCITAHYTLTNGQKMKQSSSAYVNKIVIKGFGKSAKTTVKIVSVDKSHNESEPVMIEIEPKDSPIYEILHSLIYTESFGGLKLSWKNSVKEDVVLGILMKDEFDDYQQVESLYSSTEDVNTSVRGFESKQTDFGFYFRDTYENYTDTIYDVLTPLFEEKLDKSKFRALPLSEKFSLYGDTYIMTRLWDDISGALYQTFYIRLGEEDPYFSFDMGVEAKLSRFKLWQRMDFLFALHNPRYFEIWGTNDASKTVDPNNWDGWFKVMDCESKRPSGLPAGDDLTGEDREYALAGEEYEIPIEIPSFRYFRMYVRHPYDSSIGGTWSGSRACHLEEITIWGSAIAQK